MISLGWPIEFFFSQIKLCFDQKVATYQIYCYAHSMLRVFCNFTETNAIILFYHVDSREMC